MFRETLLSRPITIRISAPATNGSPAFNTPYNLARAVMDANTNTTWNPEKRAVAAVSIVPDEQIVIWDSSFTESGDLADHKHTIPADTEFDGFGCRDWWEYTNIQGTTTSAVACTLVLKLGDKAD